MVWENWWMGERQRIYMAQKILKDVHSASISLRLMNATLWIVKNWQNRWNANVFLLVRQHHCMSSLCFAYGDHFWALNGSLNSRTQKTFEPTTWHSCRAVIFVKLNLVSGGRPQTTLSLLAGRSLLLDAWGAPIWECRLDEESLHLPCMSLDSCVSPTIKQPCAIF